MCRVLCERSSALLLSYSAIKRLLWESLNDKCRQYLEHFTYSFYFCRILADGSLCIGYSTNGAGH